MATNFCPINFFAAQHNTPHIAEKILAATPEQDIENMRSLTGHEPQSRDAFRNFANTSKRGTVHRMFKCKNRPNGDLEPTKTIVG